MNRGYNLGLKMTQAQTLLGWMYLPFYVLLISLGLDYLSGLLNFPMTAFSKNVAYFAINFTFVLCVYGKFLVKSFQGFTSRFWQFIQALILGFALYFFSSYVLSWVLNLLQKDLPNYNDQNVSALLAQNKTIMFLCILVVVPIVEEVLFRGVLFGSLHGKNRIAAYVVSVLLFAAVHVWQYYSTAGLWVVLLNTLQYVPAAVAFAWTYEKSGTIWTSIVLHISINAMTLGLSPHF